MQSVAINLDDVVGPDHEFVLNGETFYLPADIPAESMVRLMDTWQRASDGDESEEAAMMREVYEQILGFFRIRQPELHSSFELTDRVREGEITEEERADFPELKIGLQQIGVVMGAINTAYNDAPEDEDEDAVPLDRPARSASSNGSSPSKKPSAGGRKTGARSAGANSARGTKR